MRVFLAILLFVGGGVVSLVALVHLKGPVRCGDGSLEPGQSCAFVAVPGLPNGGYSKVVGTGGESYAEVERRQHSEGRSLLAVSSIAVLAGAGLLLWRRWESTARPRGGRRPAIVERVRQGVGWRGIVGLVCVVGGLWTAVSVGFAGTSPGLWLVPGWTVIGLLALAARLGGYTRSQSTAWWEDVVGPLVRSSEEYCLVLRPFGADGRILLPHLSTRLSVRLPITATATLEEVVARAAKKALGMKTYALVDPDERFAPPGPVWLRAPAEHDGWKAPIEALIARAHSIVLILPPEQDIRPSVKWEIRQITHRDLQTRVVLVLPPPDQDMNDYLHAYHQMCVVLATFQGFAGEVDEHLHPDDPAVEHYRNLISKDALMAKMSRVNPFEDPRLLLGKYVEARFAAVGARTYSGPLEDAFADTRAQLSTLGFDARYPFPRER